MTVKLEIKELGDESFPTICLNMIVKDEADIIKNTLMNLCSKIKFSYWVICDTGSTDTTKEIIIEFFKEKDISGELHDVPWRDFGYNRSKALEFAYKKSDFLLHFDADDRIEGNLVLPNLLEKGYGYHMKFGSGVNWKRMPLVDNHIKWYYEGVMHEIIATKEHYETKLIEGDYFIATNVEVSARNKRGSLKFVDDAKLLEEAFEKKDHLQTRYCFYCAECWRFSGNKENAIKWYKKTLTLLGWIQERYWSCFQLGHLYRDLNEPEKSFYYYALSYEYDDNRQEALYEIIHKSRLAGKHNIALAYYKLLKPIKDKGNKLFVINHIYDYSLDIDISISGYYANEFYLAIKSFKNLFKNSEKIPIHLLKLTVSNFRFYIDKLDDKDQDFYNKFKKFINLLERKNITFPEEQKQKIEKLFNNNNKSYFIK